NVSIELKMSFDPATESQYDIVMDECCLICYDKQRNAENVKKIREMFPQCVSETAIKSKVPLPECVALKVPSIKEYFEINMRLLENFSQCFSMKGYCAEKSAFVGMNTILSTGADPRPPIIIDNNTQIEEGCKIGPDAIIGELSLIDSDTRLRRVIVAERTYVGKDLDIFEKIVVGRSIICPYDGSVVEMPDNYAYAYSSPSRIRRFFEVVFAALLLVILLPWRIFFIFSTPAKRYCVYKDNNGKIHNFYFYMRSKGLMKSWFFKLSQDKIPRLFAVIGGKMALVGDSMQILKDPENLRYYGGTYKPGVFSYPDSIGKKDKDWKVMDDIHYKHHKNFYSNAALILRTFITRFFGDQT
ncbi:MAG: sugar transferase, partial [Opitutales bacterium]|nr:sugar transferase [Opitutales bacterium]